MIIEVDRLSHSWVGHASKDIERDVVLSKLGYKILRFDDNEVIKDIDNVKRTIENFINDFEINHPFPPSKGETNNQKHD